MLRVYNASNFDQMYANVPSQKEEDGRETKTEVSADANQTNETGFDTTPATQSSTRSPAKKAARVPVVMDCMMMTEPLIGNEDHSIDMMEIATSRCTRICRLQSYRDFSGSVLRRTGVQLNANSNKQSGPSSF